MGAIFSLKIKYLSVILINTNRVIGKQGIRNRLSSQETNLYHIVHYFTLVCIGVKAPYINKKSGKRKR